MTHLDDLAIKYKSDKSTAIGNSHAYTLIYDMLFRTGRHSNLNILEVGLCIGGPENGGDPNRKVHTVPSIDMWKEYFPNSHIYGFDISDFSEFEDDRFTFIRGDCGSKSDLSQVNSLGKEFDVIIDDASHASFHQFMTMSVLWSSLKSGGLSIVEDLDWQPEQYEAELPTTPKFGSYFRSFIETGEFPEELNIEDFSRIEQEIYFAWVYTVGELREMRALRRQRRNAVDKYSPTSQSIRQQRSSWLNQALKQFGARGRARTPYLAVIQKS